MPPRTAWTEKQQVVRRFMDILSDAGIYLHPQCGHRYIKWNAFPEHVWDRGVFVRLPREIIFSSPTQTVEERVARNLNAPWTDENVEIMKEALDAGEVKVLPRPLGWNIIFETFDRNGTITEVPRFTRRERIRRKRHFADEQTDSQYDSNDATTEEEAESTDDEVPELSSKREISRFLRDLHRTANIEWKGMDSSWSDLPRMMIKRKLYLAGLPEICAPQIVDDEVDPDSFPSMWSSDQRDQFLDAARSDSITLLRRESDDFILFGLVNEDGSTYSTSLEYSRTWMLKHTQTPVVNNEKTVQRQRREARENGKSSRIPPNAVITSSGRGWVVVEESTEDEEEDVVIENPKELRKQLRIQVSTRVLKQIVDWDIRGDGSEVTWNNLPLALAQYNKYVTGLPPASLPKIRDDKVIFQASHPCLWSGEMITRVLAIVDSGKFQVLPRPPGRIVLFETFDAEGNPYDSTLGYSDDWLALNMQDETFAERRAMALQKEEQKRAKAQAAAEAREKQEKKREEVKLTRSMMPVVRKASGGLTDREKKIAHNAKVRQESDQGRANVHAVARLWHGINSDRRDNGTAGGSTSHLSLPGAYGATFSGTSTPRSTSPSQYHTAVNTPAVPMEVEPPPMHPRHAFRGKRISYATSTSNNQGNPSSNATNDQSRRSVDTLMSSPSLAPLTESHSSHWSPALSKSKVETQSTIPPQRRPTWPPPGYPKVEWEMVDKNGLLGRLSRFFGRYQLGAEPTTIPWATLPQLLAERRQYLRGVPFVCIPIVTNDQVDDLSAPWNWNGELLGAMDWALVNNQLSFNARESGRRVLFEIIDENGAFSDSTLGYSDHWLNQFLPDTNPNSSPNSQSFNEPLTPVVSLKRSREDQDSPISPGDMSVDHDTKRRRPNGASSSVSPVDSRSERSVEPREKSFIERSWRDSSSASNETVAEEVIDPRELPLNRLVPSSLPPPLRKGRVFLRFGPVDATMGSSDGKEMEEETWEWIPPAGTPMGMKSSTVWNPTQARWRLVTGGRSLENLGSIETKEKTEFPDPMDGIILKYGSCEYVEERGQWEMIPHRNAEAFPWRIRWDEIFARWEWTPLPEPSQGA